MQQLYKKQLLFSPLSLPHRSPKIARPKTLLGFSKTAKHGFVFSSESILDISQQSRLRFLTEVFSDNVIPIQDGLFYGSLAYTWNYFGSRDLLQRHVDKKNLENTHVVVGEHLFRTFVYLLKCGCHAGFQFACGEDLGYRRFLNRLTWDEWAHGAARFYEIMTLDKNEGFRRELILFVQSLKQLRFKSPGQVAMECTHLPTALMERFGGRCAWLWNAWIANDDDVMWPPFKKHVEALNPAHFETAVFETPEFTGRYVLHAQEFLEGVQASLVHCLNKISKFNESTRSYGLQDFKVMFTVQSIKRIERVVSLAVPLYEWNKTTASIVEMATTHLLDAVEEKVDDNTTRVYHLTHISDLSLMPLQLSMKQRHASGLFGEVYDSQILEVRNTLRAFDKSRIELYRTQPELPIKQSFATIEQAWVLPISAEHPTAAAWLRPVCILKASKKIEVRQLKIIYPYLVFFKTEIIGQWSYYAVKAAKNTSEEGHWLWLAILTGTPLSFNAQGLLLGFFDSEFTLPVDILATQRCAYV